MSLAHAPEWYAERRKGLGASDAPIVAGVSPYRKPFDLWLEKTGQTEAPDLTDRMARGQRLEPVAAQWYSELTGRKVRRRNKPVRHRRMPFLFAHLDRTAEDRIVEIKTAYREWEEVPEHVQVQVQHQLGLTGYGMADVALMTFETLRVYEVPRDDLLIRELFELEQAWWQRHVIGGEPPYDGSESAGRYLNRVSPEGPPMQATAEQAIAIKQLHDVRAQARKLGETEQAVIEWLKRSMVGSSALEGDSFSVSWKTTKERTKVDWKAVAEVMAPFDATAYQAAVGAATTVEEGTRPFRVTFKEET